MNATIPAYYQIKNTIKDWIINKDYSAGDKIPSENELSNLFNANRLTVRQGIALLIQEGLLKSKRGEGTFVTTDKELINSLGLDFTGFIDGLFSEVVRAKVKSAQIERIPCSLSIKNKLELSADEVICIKRVRLLNDKIFAYTVNYLPLEIGLKINESELFKRPLLQIIEQDFGIEFEEAFQTIEASFSDMESSEKMGISPGSPILFVERIMYGKNKRPVELVQTSYRGDYYKYVVRLKRDKSKEKKQWVQLGE